MRVFTYQFYPDRVSPHGRIFRIPYFEAMESHKMEGKLTETEVAMLRTATEKGVINIPCGTAMEIDAWRDLLAGMQKKGVVTRDENAGYYSHFHLTDSGRFTLVGLRSLQKKQAAGSDAPHEW